MLEFVMTVAAVLVAVAIIWCVWAMRRWYRARQKPEWSVVIPPSRSR